MKIRYFIYIFSLIAMIIITMVIFKYYHFKNSKEVPICNLNIRSSTDPYVYLNISCKSKLYSIVSPNEELYYILRKEKWFPIFPIYVYRIGKIIENNDYLEVSASLFNDLEYFKVDSNFVNLLKIQELLKDTSLIEKNKIRYSIPWEKEKAIIYILLKRGINCVKDCESGRTYFSKHIPLGCVPIYHLESKSKPTTL